MKTNHLPAAAVWLLHALKVTDHNPALIGDLAEECSAGRSRVWLWREVLAAIVFAMGKEIYSHKLLAMRAVIVGEAAVWVTSFAINTAWWWTITALAWHWPWLLMWLIAFTGFLGHAIPRGSLVGLMLGGWVVGRFHRDQRTAFVFLFAALHFLALMVPGFSELHRLAVNSIDQPRFRSYLEADIAFLLLSPLAVLLGGYLARNWGRSIPQMPEERD